MARPRRLRAVARHLASTPTATRSASPPTTVSSPIDVIDVSPWTQPASSTDADRAAAAAALGASFESTGFALIVGHGVDASVHGGMRENSLAFFHLSLEEKMRYSEGKGYGYGGYLNCEENGAQLLGDFSRPADHVESVSLAESMGAVGAKPSTAIGNKTAVKPSSAGRPTVDGEPLESDA